MLNNGELGRGKNMLEIVVASNNDHKIKELEAMFENKVKLFSLKEVGINVNPDENGKTYEENAYIKASEVAKYTTLPVLSDDSGIEISALGEHFPGIYSHRYAEENGGQAALNEKLIHKCPHSPARFTCHFVLLNLKNFKRVDFEGYMDGKINDKIEGINGFGYDPIFVPNGYLHSVATLPFEEKNKISHRYNASIQLLKFLKDNGLID